MFSNFASHFIKFRKNIPSCYECNHTSNFSTLDAKECTHKGIFTEDILRRLDLRYLHNNKHPRLTIPLDDLRRFVEDCFCSVGVPENNSTLLANMIVLADAKGVFGEGVLRLEKYIQEIQNGTCNPTAEPTIESETCCVAVVNGKNGLGPVIGRFCMNLAVEKTSGSGVAMVVAKGSNHYGMASLYAAQALKKGYMGLSFSNSVPQMVPPGALNVALGANPIAIAAPAHSDAFIADLSSTTVTLAKIRYYKQRGWKIPKGWALNEKGLPEENPDVALASKMLSPLGGDQSHKGYGLAIGIEALSSLLADANYGSKIPSEPSKEPPNLGHGFIVIDPQEFAPEFDVRMSTLLKHLRNMEPADPKRPVMAPGDKERFHMKKVDCQGGICYCKMQLQILDNLTKSLKVQPIKRLKEIMDAQDVCATETKKVHVNTCNDNKAKPKFVNSEEKKTCPPKDGAKKHVAPQTAPIINEQPITPVEEARRFMIDCFKAVGTPEEHAQIVTDNLIEADCRGYYSHGMNRLEKYLKDIKEGVCDSKATCTIDKQTASTALVNGNNGLGAVIGKYCMDLAIKKAKETGIAVVAVHGSNHYGISQIYPLQAIKQGCLGMCFTNTSPYMVPTRAKEAALGTNPLSLGAPACDGNKFVLDITTTAVALGKIELSKRKGERILEGWALNDEGKVETDPEIAYKAGKLLPLGGTETHAGFKGYSLGIFVDIMCGILSGSKYGPFIRKWGGKSDIANLGHGFIAINPNCFTSGFEERMNDLIKTLKEMKPLDPNRPILVHGDIEKRNLDKVQKDGGLTYVKNQHETNTKLAQDLQVKPMGSKSPDK